MVKFGSPALMAFIVRGREILVLKYSNFYNHPDVNQKYVFPGGRPNEGENLVDALEREVQEETGLEGEVQDPIYIDLFENKPNGKIRPIMYSECKIVDYKDVELSEEHESYKWVSLEDAKLLDWVDNCFVRFLNQVSFD